MAENGSAHHSGRPATDHGIINLAAGFLDNQHLQQTAVANLVDAKAYFTWLRKRTAQYHVAHKEPCWDHETMAYKVDGQGNFILEPRPINTNDKILSVLTTHHGWLYKMTNECFREHMAGQETYYFQGEGRQQMAETLVNIDIDCLKSLGLGYKDGGQRFADYLKTAYFPDLCFEESTNGNGVHGYFVLQKLGVHARDVNGVLRTFEKWLKQEARKVGADIEGVEIKGTCPVFEYQDGKLVNVKAGTNAKLPRRGIRATTHIDITDLAKFVPVEEDVPLVRNCSVGSSSASWCPKAITPADLADMPRLRDVALKLGLPTGKCSGRVAVTVEDMAVFLLLLRFFTGNMNDNGTLPWARFEALWTALYHAGDIGRAFNPKRFAAVRNHLSSLVVEGEVLLEWEDSTYSMGRACKWRASEKLLDMMREEREEVSSTEAEITILDDYPRPRPAWQCQMDEKAQNIRLMTRIREFYENKRRLAA